jgi:hypothetical protein
MQFSFPSQPASDECPAVPRSIRVEADTLAEATKKLAKALKADPNLSKPHPELDK